MRFAPVKDPPASEAAVRLRIAPDRQPTNAQPGVVENDDASIFQGLFNRRQIGQQQFGLPLRSPVPHLPKEDQRRPSLGPQRQQGGKIRIGRYEDAVLALGALENCVICRGLHRVVPDMHGIIAGAAEQIRDERRERVVDEEPHLFPSAADERQLALANRLGGIAEGLADVFPRQI